VEAVQVLLSHHNPKTDSATATATTKAPINLNAQNRITGGTALHCTIQSSKKPALRRVECARLLIAAGADPGVSDLYGMNPLDHLENENGDADDEFKDAMRSVLNSGFGDEGEAGSSIQVLFDILERGDLEGLKNFIPGNNVNVDLNGRDRTSGLTPLLFLTERVIDLCAQPDDNSDHVDVLRVQVQMMKILVENGADPNDVASDSVRKKRKVESGMPVMGFMSMGTPAATTESSEEDKDEERPLHKLCLALSSANAAIGIDNDNDNDDTVFAQLKQMIQNLHSASRASSSSPSPLSKPTTLLQHDAARRGRAQTLRFLIESLGADPNAVGRQGMTPLHFAARSGRVEVVRYLLSLEDDRAKLEVGRRDDGGKTALDAAVANGREEVVALLKDKMDA
jgi:ankyrin repeat protein